MRPHWTDTYNRLGRPYIGGPHAASARMAQFDAEAVDVLVQRHRAEYDKLFEMAASHFWDMNDPLEGPRGPHGPPHIKSDQDGGDPGKEARPHDQNDDPSEQPQEP